MLFRRQEAGLDPAVVQDMGDRNYQEDHFHFMRSEDGDVAVCVIADGLGGHPNGHVASSLVVQALSRTLSYDFIISSHRAGQLRSSMQAAVETANLSIAQYIEKDPSADGMASTLVLVVCVNETIYWLSIGDSVLYRFDENGLNRLNRDHSVAESLKALVAANKITEEAAASHPMRNSLVSTLSGKVIDQLDVAREEAPLQRDEMLLLASDGLLTLNDDAIAKQLGKSRRQDANETAETMLKLVLKQKSERQDNVTIGVIKLWA